MSPCECQLPSSHETSLSSAQSRDIAAYYTRHDATVCPIHVIGGATRSGAVFGIVLGAVVGGCINLAALFSLVKESETLTLDVFVITVCTTGLIGVATGLAGGFWKLDHLVRSQRNRS